MGMVGLTNVGLKHTCVIAVSPVMPPTVIHCPAAADIGAGCLLAVDVHTAPTASGAPHTSAPPAAENVMPAMPPALVHTRRLRIWSPGARL